MTQFERIGMLLLTQGTRPEPVEDELLRGDVTAYRPAPSTTLHQNSTNIVDLAGGLRAFHKPVRGVNGELGAVYGHDPSAMSVNECAAWRLARFLGAPYNRMVPVTVLRYHEAASPVRLQYPQISDGWGSLASEQPGVSLDPEPMEIASVNDSAAFFDALIAQQDRHGAQYRWEASLKHLGLIDHGFSFARPGDVLNESVFVRRRHLEGREKLDKGELDALARIESAYLIGLRDVLHPDQSAALGERIKRMRKSGEVLAPGEW